MKLSNPIDKLKIKSLEKEVNRLKAENLHVREEFRKFEKFAAQLFSKQPAQNKIQRLNKKTKSAGPGEDDDSPETYLTRMLNLADACFEIKDDVEADLFLSIGELPLLAANMLSGFDGQRVIYDCVGIPDYVSETDPGQEPKSITHLLRRVLEDNCTHCRSIIAGSPMLADYFKATDKPVECIESFHPGSESEKPSSTLRDLCGITDEKLLFFYSSGNVFQIETLIDALDFLPDECHLAIVLQKKIDNQLQQMRLAKKIQATSFDHRIHLLEDLPDENPVSFAGGADLAVILQNMKSLPQQLALPEYVFDFMAANIFICCTATDPARYLMGRYPYGKLIVRQAPEDLSKTINDVLSTDGNRAPIKREVNGELSWKSQMDNFLKTIGEKKKIVTLITADLNRSSHRVVNMASTLQKAGKKVNIITRGKSKMINFNETDQIRVYKID